MSQFCNDIKVDFKRVARQGATITLKLFTATLQNVMRTLQWDNTGVKIKGRQLHHPLLAYVLVLTTTNISQAERMLAHFHKASGMIDPRLNLAKTIFMRKALVSYDPLTLNGTYISECSCNLYLGREMNMLNDLSPELSRRKRAAWGAIKSIEDVVKRTINARLRAHLFDSTVLPALTYASECWSLRKQE
uniref:Reverse transcriptase domain-containing protein n=1 Tax=Angiostrongylus cantonensis TaxID=6313 RepID=A0A0K0D4F3_ANGCA